MLRRYNEIGLLKPAEIKITGIRERFSSRQRGTLPPYKMWDFLLRISSGFLDRSEALTETVR